VCACMCVRTLSIEEMTSPLFALVLAHESLGFLNKGEESLLHALLATLVLGPRLLADLPSMAEDEFIFNLILKLCNDSTISNFVKSF